MKKFDVEFCLWLPVKAFKKKLDYLVKSIKLVC